MFTVFDKILKKQNITDEDIEKISSFVMNQWLSGDRVGVQFANIFNQYDNIPIRQRIQVLQGLMPVGIKYIKYPKKNKEKDRYLDLLMKHFNVRMDTAKLYYDILTVDELVELEEQYTIGGVKRK
jgi:hypothetical protein